MNIDWTAGVQATSYGSGPFYPAIRNGRHIWYWPNITMLTKDEAQQRARYYLADALKSAIERIAEWNIHKV